MHKKAEILSFNRSIINEESNCCSQAKQKIIAEKKVVQICGAHLSPGCFKGYF